MSKRRNAETKPDTETKPVELTPSAVPTTFRERVVQAAKEALAILPKPREWNDGLLWITQGRRTKEFEYPWDGDFVAHCLAVAGATDGPHLNRRPYAAKLETSHLLRCFAGAGDRVAFESAVMKALGDTVPAVRFAHLGYPDRELNEDREKQDNSPQKCADGYEVQPGDVVLTEGKLAVCVGVTDRGLDLVTGPHYGELAVRNRRWFRGVEEVINVDGYPHAAT